MPRRANKVDDNHSEIIAAIRAAGISVYNTSVVGQGFPDIVCGYGGRTYLVEIKDGAKTPSQRRLKPQQEAFRASWLGHYQILETEAQTRLWCIAVTKEV